MPKFSDFLAELDSSSEWIEKATSKGGDAYTINFNINLELLRRYHRWLMANLNPRALDAEQPESKP